MAKRTLGMVLIIVGVVLMVVSLAADVLGVGARPGIGTYQTVGAVVGALVVVGGAWWGWRKVTKK